MDVTVIHVAISDSTACASADPMGTETLDFALSTGDGGEVRPGRYAVANGGVSGVWYVYPNGFPGQTWNIIDGGVVVSDVADGGSVVGQLGARIPVAAIDGTFDVGIGLPDGGVLRLSQSFASRCN